VSDERMSGIRAQFVRGAADARFPTGDADGNAEVKCRAIRAELDAGRGN